ncbi:MAG: hypothetical protein AAGJ93_03610 [Bacteroidota bacterium]
MKMLSYFGLAIFYIGIIVFFGREFKPDFFESINELLINAMWPVGLLIYSVAKAVDKKNKA